MTKLKPLHHKYLRLALSISQFSFKTTNEIKLLTGFVGQERALQAIKFGIGIKSDGYNLYAMGPTGLGKRSLIKDVLSAMAEKAPTPPDWCYVHNFRSPENPIALRLSPGDGFKLQHDMDHFIAEVGLDIQTLLESDDYRARQTKITNYYDKRRKILKKSSDSYIDKSPHLYKMQHMRENNLQRKVVIAALKPAIAKLIKRYAKYKSVTKYFSSVYHDIIHHIDDFISHDEKTNLVSFSQENPLLIKYKVNLLVDNRKLKGSPIVFDESPSYSSLISRVEHDSVQGFMTTNFRLIKAGSLHRANGGYLILEIRKLKENKECWEALKRALYARKITIKPLEEDNNFVKPLSLEPMSIPLKVKVILIGSRNTYYSLCEKDPDFLQLFKVPVDFDEEIIRNSKNIQLYAKLIATIIKRKKLLPFHVKAVAAIIDYSSRLIEDNSRLTTKIRDIQDIMFESDYWARFRHNKLVRAVDVARAIETQSRRMDRSRELYYDDIRRGFIIINTTGKAIGQINCLSVRRVGDFSYGHPTRVTARVHFGKGKFIDIQREIKMAGPLHSKAGMIISNYLASCFNRNQLVALSASISFEQIYGWTDGDSASVGELCALLSALAGVPIYQNYAITGSIDQYGEVQAVGGINAKIEGFYDVCKSRGLNGKQGVLIPAINVKNLMLREDVVAAVKSKKFCIYPINTIDEAVFLMTGWEAGERDKKGSFTKGSLFKRIEDKLDNFPKK